MGTIMSWVYTAISWIMLEWHALWDKAGIGYWAKTNWQWTLAIVFLVLTVRTILFPVVVKQIKSQRAIQALQPKIKELQEKHKGDRQALQAAQMELMRQEKANPLMGCLPMVIQIPVFIGVFHVLRHLKPTQPYHEKILYGWTAKLFDSASSARLFGAPISASIRSTNSDLALLHTSRTNVTVVAGILIAIMIVTTYLTSRQLILKTGRATDPTQRMMQNVMMYFIPVSLLVSGSIFPIGSVIYYVTTNLFSLGQQYYVLRKFPPPPMPAAVPGASGGLSSLFGNRTAPAATNGKPAIGAKPVLGAKPANGKPMLNGKSVGAQKSNGKAAKNATPVVEVKPPVGPKVGAKPTNPKKGTPAKSTPTKSNPTKR